jgi:hypothetical protein
MFVTATSRELMFRAKAGIGVGAREAWLGHVTLPSAHDTCLSMSSGACTTHLRNPKIDFWDKLRISEVNVLHSETFQNRLLRKSVLHECRTIFKVVAEHFFAMEV